MKTVFLHELPEAPRPLHSMVAWPPEVLDTWMRRQQERLNVRSFGLPHLNLRAPFQTTLSANDLVCAVREVVRDQPVFDVTIKGWKRLPSVIFLECELSAELADLHRRLLEVGPSSRAPYDGEDYRPHLTLALGVLPWASDYLWQEVQSLQPPVRQFQVTALSLTREERGEVQELHTYPLLGAENVEEGSWLDRVPEGPPSQ